jgi:group I intron endonuclease
MSSGIYQIRNLVNNKCYIGSSINLKNRKHDHFKLLRSNKHKNRHLQNAWNKYSEQNFIFEIIEYCDPNDLIIREQWYLDNWNPEYNISQIAGNTLGLACSEETKLKISLANIGKIPNKETRQKLSVAGKGRKFTHTHKEKISNALKGKIRSKQHCENISRALKLRNSNQTPTL